MDQIEGENWRTASCSLSRIFPVLLAFIYSMTFLSCTRLLSIYSRMQRLALSSYSRSLVVQLLITTGPWAMISMVLVLPLLSRQATRLLILPLLCSSRMMYMAFSAPSRSFDKQDLAFELQPLVIQGLIT